MQDQEIMQKIFSFDEDRCLNLLQTSPDVFDIFAQTGTEIMNIDPFQTMQIKLCGPPVIVKISYKMKAFIKNIPVRLGVQN